MAAAASFYEEYQSSFPELIEEATAFLEARSHQEVVIPVRSHYSHRVTQIKKIEEQLRKFRTYFRMTTIGFLALLAIEPTNLDDLVERYSGDGSPVSIVAAANFCVSLCNIGGVAKYYCMQILPTLP